MATVRDQSEPRWTYGGARRLSSQESFCTMAKGGHRFVLPRKTCREIKDRC